MADLLVQAVGAFGGTLAFAFVLNAPRRIILPVSFIGVSGYVLYVLLARVTGEMFAYFAATVFIAVLCEIEARTRFLPSTIFLLSALVPLVPGYNFYCAMLALVENNGAAAAQHGLVAIQIVASIAIGTAVVSVGFRSLMRHGHQ